LLKAALPAAAVETAQLQGTAHERLEFRRLRWTQELCIQVAVHWAVEEGYLPSPSLTSVADPALLDAAAAFLSDIRGEFLPGDWIILIESLLDLHTLRRRPLSAGTDTADLRRRVYRGLAPLQIEPDGSGVRRGVRHLKVRETPLGVLRELLCLQSSDTRDALRKLVGSDNNLHKQISELRKAVEPLPHGSRDWVYICNSADGNYILEGIDPSAVVRSQSV
jgi:hypothetical protein